MIGLLLIVLIVCGWTLATELATEIVFDILEWRKRDRK